MDQNQPNGLDERPPIVGCEALASDLVAFAADMRTIVDALREECAGEPRSMGDFMCRAARQAE
jgi:hypothetical protein